MFTRCCYCLRKTDDEHLAFFVCRFSLLFVCVHINQQLQWDSCAQIESKLVHKPSFRRSDFSASSTSQLLPSLKLLAPQCLFRQKSHDRTVFQRKFEWHRVISFPLGIFPALAIRAYNGTEDAAFVGCDGNFGRCGPCWRCCSAPWSSSPH